MVHYEYFPACRLAYKYVPVNDLNEIHSYFGTACSLLVCPFPHLTCNKCNLKFII